MGRWRPLVQGAAEGHLIHLVVIGSILAGIVLRWWVFTGPLGYADLDEATVGIQAEGFFKSPDVFFQNQPYGGTGETILLAVLFKVFGSSVWLLKLVPALLHAAAALVTWRASRRIINGVTGQVAVPVLLWCAPAYAVWWSTKERGFYGLSILIVAVTLLLVVRLAERPTTLDAVGLGLSAGIGWWTSPLVALVTVPAVIWLIARRPKIMRLVPHAGLGALVGASPWIVWNVRHGWKSLQQAPSYGVGTIDRIEMAIAKIPALVGIATPYEPGRALLPAASWVAVIGLTAAVALATSRTKTRAPFLLLVLVAGYLILYPMIKNTGTVGLDLRYLYLLLPALALVAGALIPNRRSDAAGALLLGGVATLAVATSLWGLVGLRNSSSSDAYFFRSAPGLDEVIDRLEEEGVTRVVSDGAGPQITFVTDGRIRASSFAVPRFIDLEQVSWAEGPSTYVLDGSERAFRNPGRLERAAAERGITYDREQHGAWVIYFLDSWLPPWEAGMTTFIGGVIPPERP